MRRRPGGRPERRLAAPAADGRVFCRDGCSSPSSTTRTSSPRESEIDAFTAGKEKLFFTDFYVRQRKRLKMLLTPDGKPVGGKWSFDADNRKKLPTTVHPPAPAAPPENEFVREAREYVRTHFPNAPGADTPFVYPTSAARRARVAGRLPGTPLRRLRRLRGRHLRPRAGAVPLGAHAGAERRAARRRRRWSTRPSPTPTGCRSTRSKGSSAR